MAVCKLPPRVVTAVEGGKECVSHRQVQQNLSALVRLWLRRCYGGRVHFSANDSLYLRVRRGLVSAKNPKRNSHDLCCRFVGTALRSRAANLRRDCAEWRPHENARQREALCGHLPSEG